MCSRADALTMYVTKNMAARSKNSTHARDKQHCARTQLSGRASMDVTRSIAARVPSSACAYHAQLSGRA